MGSGQLLEPSNDCFNNGAASFVLQSTNKRCRPASNRSNFMAISAPPRERTCEEQEVWLTDHALTFEEYLAEYEGVKEHVELIRGVPTNRMAANIPHER